MDYILNVSQWNVKGLNDPLKVKQIGCWLRKNKQEDSILCLHELKVKKDIALFQSGLINQTGVKLVDCDESGRVGAVMLIPHQYPISDQGGKGDGTFVWACVGEISIGSIYTPNERRDCKALWKWLTTNLKQSQWIFIV